MLTQFIKSNYQNAVNMEIKIENDLTMIQNYKFIFVILSDSFRGCNTTNNLRYHTLIISDFTPVPVIITVFIALLIAT